MSATPLVSASQINKYRECRRSWAWSYLAKIRTPQHPAAALGTEVDDEQLQPYLREGKPFNLAKESGQIAETALPFLPKPMLPGLQIQKHFVLPSPSWETTNFAYQGYQDLALPDSSAMPHCGGGVPLVSDFKTTKHWRYIKTPEALKTDVQAQLYAMNALVETGAREVDLLWLFMHTVKPYKAKPIYVRVTAAHVGEQFAKIEETAVEMFHVRQAFETTGLPPERAEEFIKRAVKPTARMCEEYNGCPHRSRCNLSPEEINASLNEDIKRRVSLLVLPPKDSLMSISTIDLLAGLKIRKGDAPVPVMSPTPVQLAPAPVGGATGYELSPQQLDGQAAADAGVAKVEVLPAWATAGVDPIKKPLGINPPESLLPPAPFVSASTDLPVVVSERVQEPKKRGRPAGSKNTKVEAPVAVDPYEAAIEAASQSPDDLTLTIYDNSALFDLAATVGAALTKFSQQARVVK